MEAIIAQPKITQAESVLTTVQMLEHWQGHRKLTRRIIEAFPEAELFSYSVGGMRPFSELAYEMIDIAGRGIAGIATGKWTRLEESAHTGSTGSLKTKQDLLDAWDDTTNQINQWWAHIAPGRFQENDLAFGLFEGPMYSTLLYIIDNETHHRGQGYVYLRALNITPPPFWERA
jgi:uncharacterized damage-inducible protein DinB